MKWDYTSNPPRAWKVIDGDVVFVDERDVCQCSCCNKWYVLDPLSTNKGLCSLGCMLRQNEISDIPKNKI